MPPDEATARGRPVRRRHVFYVRGFDPLGPSRYHALYREQAAAQSLVNRMAIRVGPRRNEGTLSSAWSIEAELDGQATQTWYECLRWDDIVREHWPRQGLSLVRLGATTLIEYARSRVLLRFWRAYPIAFHLLVLPAVLLLFTLLALLAVASAGAAAAAHASPWAAWSSAGVAAVGIIGLATTLQRRLQLAWLLRSYGFSVRQARGEVPSIETRLDAFAERIAAAANDPSLDEVLVVGHSSGAQMAVSAVARAIERGAVGAAQGDGGHEGRPGLALMTLGQCIPILSWLPGARRLRQELATVARHAAWTWLDFTAPADGCSFVLFDPTIGCDDVPGASQNRPKLLSTRFATLFSPATYSRLRKEKMRYHFQYLSASELPGAYDFFAITAGPHRLDARFADARSVVDFHRGRDRRGA